MNYRERRNKLMEDLEDGSIAFLFSGKAPVRSADEAYPFVVNRSFYYMTGIDRENMTLMLIKNEDRVISSLFIEPYDPDLARWVGGRMRPEEAKREGDVDEVFSNEEFNSVFHREIQSCPFLSSRKIGLDLSKNDWDQADDEAYKVAAFLSKQYPQLSVVNLHPTLAMLRMIKDEDELELMRKAQTATIVAVKSMMRYCRPGINETELEGAFDFGLMRQGIREHAFPTICASGQNSTTLHYSSNNEMIEDGDLVLCDLGGAFGHYCADMTRTFPANGKFTDRQKQIYDIVLEGQRLVMDAICPGVTLRQLNQTLLRFYAVKLKEIGLLENGRTVRDYYFHGVSHHLGLDTHDVSLNAMPLQPGMVITVEPGLYLAEEGIGIRIEDDVLVTKKGYENLSAAMLHTTEEIEAYMNKGE